MNWFNTSGVAAPWRALVLISFIRKTPRCDCRTAAWVEDIRVDSCISLAFRQGIQFCGDRNIFAADCVWCNEPCADSCIAVILRHAWLSPWNKHMTTGRINQISIVYFFWRWFLRSRTLLSHHKIRNHKLISLCWFCVCVFSFVEKPSERKGRSSLNAALTFLKWISFLTSGLSWILVLKAFRLSGGRFLLNQVSLSAKIAYERYSRSPCGKGLTGCAIEYF